MDSFSLEFEDVVYEVVNNTRSASADKYLRLIRGMSGRFESGRLTAIMGPSGSCKTTFLNLLIGRILSSSRTCGTVTFRGKPRAPMEWLSQHSYLEQDDCIVSGQTVREFITFSVLCRRKNSTEKDVDQVVTDVMEELHISRLGDTVMDSLSGGERKRVMIAIEFAVSPDVLILDEPTSGLDSHLALQLMHMLKTYAARHNKIVIMTIHQPGSGLFQMIDHLYFMYRGTIIYDGAVSDLEQFFQKHGFEITGSLSKPEFLFELFTEYSVFKEIRDYKGAVEAIAEEKRTEAARSVEGAQLVAGTDTALDFSLHPKHIALIFKRAMLLQARKVSSVVGFLVSNVAYTLGFVFYICSICSVVILSHHEKYKKDLPDASFWRLPYLLRPFLQENLPLASSFMLNHFSVLAASTTVILGLFQENSTFGDKGHLRREVMKGTYSVGSLYVSMMAVELVLVTVRVLGLLMAIFAYNLADFTYPSVYLYLAAGAFASKTLCLLFEAVSPGGLFSNILSVMKFVIYSMGDFSNVCKYNRLCKGSPLEYALYLLKVLLLIWSPNFIQSCFLTHFLGMGEALYNGIMAGPDKDSTGVYRENFHRLGGLNLFEMYSTGRIRGWLFGEPYPAYMDFVFAVAAVLMTVGLTLFVLRWRLAPALRVALAK